jgi:tetratricopeptide (TPR) repeat protein
VTGRDRLLSAALLAGLLAYGIHACYDWDWDIPGVTLPVLVFAGVLAGAGARTSRQGDRLTHAFGPGVRLAALAAGTAVLCAFAISGAVPSIAAGRAATALVEASSSSRAMLERALGSARSATRLDPLSDAGPLASTTIALHLGELHRAREYALVAIQRDPTDVHAWVELAAIEYRLRDVSNWLTALKRAAALDPMGKSTTSLLRFAELVSARSANSAAGRVAPERVTTGALRSPAARP